MQSNKLILLSSLLALLLCAAPYGCSGKYEGSQTPGGPLSEGSSASVSHDGQVYPLPGSDGTFSSADGSYHGGDGTFSHPDGVQGDGFYHAPEGCICGSDGVRYFGGDGVQFSGDGGPTHVAGDGGDGAYPEGAIADAVDGWDAADGAADGAPADGSP